MRAFQSFLGQSRRSVRHQRTLLPTIEQLDGRWLPSAFRLMALTIPAMDVAPDSLRLVRLEARETTNPRQALVARPHVTLGQVLPGSPDRGSKLPSASGGSDDDNGASPSNSPDEPTSPFSELIDRPGGIARKDEIEAELAASSNDPLPHARAHRLHATSLLDDERAGRRKAGVNSGPRIDRTLEAKATTRPAPRTTAAGNREPAAATHPARPDWYGADRGSHLVGMEGPTTAMIAGGSQPADEPGPCPATAGPGEVAPRIWGIALARLAFAPALTDRPGARETGPIHTKSCGKKRRVESQH